MLAIKIEYGILEPLDGDGSDLKVLEVSTAMDAMALLAIFKVSSGIVQGTGDVPDDGESTSSSTLEVAGKAELGDTPVGLGDKRKTGASGEVEWDVAGGGGVGLLNAGASYGSEGFEAMYGTGYLSYATGESGPNRDGPSVAVGMDVMLGVVDWESSRTVTSMEGE